MYKKITVITPCYNSEQYVRKCINAVANVNYPLEYVQHILVNDGSTDRTKEICKQAALEYPHVKFYDKPNGNWGSVINYVKNNKLANGDYVIVCDSDDIILPDAFKLVNERCQDADLVVGDFYRFNGKRKTFRVATYLYMFKTFFNKTHPTHYFNTMFCPHCTYIKREIFYDIPDLKERIVYQDGFLYPEAQKRAKTIKHITKAVSLYWNVRPGNSTSSAIKPIGIESLMSNFRYYEQNKYFEPFFYTLLGAKKIKPYLKENNIKFNFQGCKLDLTGFPWYMRPFLRLIYLFSVKKYVNKK